MDRAELADYTYDRFCFVDDEDAMLAKLETVQAAGVTATSIGGARTVRCRCCTNSATVIRRPA